MERFDSGRFSTTLVILYFIVFYCAYFITHSILLSLFFNIYCDFRFAWIMGLSITISKRSELRVSNSRTKIILRCLQRAFILILLGLMLNSIHSNSLKDLRFPGVLQLLAVSYFVCATIETIFMRMHSQVQINFFSINNITHIC